MSRELIFSPLILGAGTPKVGARCLILNGKLCVTLDTDSGGGGGGDDPPIEGGGIKVTDWQIISLNISAKWAESGNPSKGLVNIIQFSGLTKPADKKTNWNIAYNPTTPQ